MPTISSPTTDADGASEALRGTVHATRSIDDRTTICAAFGSLSQGLAPLEQALQQLVDFRNGSASTRTRTRVWARTIDQTRNSRAASYQVAWELRGAAEVAHQVAARITRAHEVEASTYDARGIPSATPVRPTTSCTVLSL